VFRARESLRDPGTFRAARSCRRLFLSVAVGFLVAEIVLRVAGVAPPPRLYRAVRGPDGAVRRIVSRVDGQPLAVTEEFAQAKAAGRLRLVFAGESTVAGYPYPPSVAFPSRFEAALHAVGADVEALNVAAAGIPFEMSVERVEEMMETDPDLLVLYAGSNEFLPYHLLRLRERLSMPLLVRLGALVRSFRTLRLLDRLLPERGGPGEIPLHPSEEERCAARAKLRDGAARVAEACRRAGLPLLVFLPACDLSETVPIAGATPWKSPEDELKVREWLQEASDRWRERNLAGARSLLEDAAALAPRHPWVHFSLGRVLLDLGESVEARRELERARDLDARPHRVTGDLRAILAGVCAEHDLPTIDAQAVLDGADPRGVAGASLFVDPNHPTPEGQILLAGALLEALAAGAAPKVGLDRDVLLDAVSRLAPASLTAEDHERARRTEATYLFPRAYRVGADAALRGKVETLLEEGARRDPPEAADLLLLGLLRLRRGDAEARDLLRRAVEADALASLDPGVLDAIGETPQSVRASATEARREER